MKNDFDLIVHRLDRELTHINIYPIGDLHIGSSQFNEEHFRRWKKVVEEDENGYIVLVGDMMDNAIQGSVTNIFHATMTPMQQKIWLKDELEPIKHKILGATQGNHEERTTRMTGDCPLYDVMAKLNKEDLYRPSMTFIKIQVGQRNKNRQVAYTIALGHGKAKTRTEIFPYTIDGLDIFVTGHFHTSKNLFKSKIVIDSKNETVSMRNFIHLSVPSFTDLGDYTLKGMFYPNDNRTFPVIRLDGRKKELRTTWM